MENLEECELLTPDELAKKLRISIKTVRKQTQKWNVPGQVKVWGRWRYKRNEIEKAILRGTF